MKLVAFLALLVIVGANVIYIVTAISNENERRREEYNARMSEQAEKAKKEAKENEKQTEAQS